MILNPINNWTRWAYLIANVYNVSEISKPCWHKEVTGYPAGTRKLRDIESCNWSLTKGMQKLWSRTVCFILRKNYRELKLINNNLLNFKCSYSATELLCSRSGWTRKKLLRIRSLSKVGKSLHLVPLNLLSWSRFIDTTEEIRKSQKFSILMKNSGLK